MKKVSAVEWLIEQLNKKGFAPVVTDEEIEQAKEMEKEQHSETWNDSRIQYKGDNYLGKEKSFEQYYNETFKNK
jgi:hypothetical protein